MTNLPKYLIRLSLGIIHYYAISVFRIATAVLWVAHEFGSEFSRIGSTRLQTWKEILLLRIECSWNVMRLMPLDSIPFKLYTLAKFPFSLSSVPVSAPVGNTRPCRTCFHQQEDNTSILVCTQHADSVVQFWSVAHLFQVLFHSSTALWSCGNQLNCLLVCELFLFYLLSHDMPNWFAFSYCDDHCTEVCKHTRHFMDCKFWQLRWFKFWTYESSLHAPMSLVDGNHWFVANVFFSKAIAWRPSLNIFQNKSSTLEILQPECMWCTNIVLENVIHKSESLSWQETMVNCLLLVLLNICIAKKPRRTWHVSVFLTLGVDFETLQSLPP